MRRTAWPMPVYSGARNAAVRPGAAFLGEVCPREESIAVFHEVICGHFGRSHGPDTLRGHFAKHLGNVCDLSFGRVDKCACWTRRI